MYATPKRQPNAVQSGDIIVLLIFVFPSVVLVILVSLNVPLSTTLAKPALRLLRLSTRLHLQSTQSASKSHPSPQGSNIPTASYNRDTPYPHPSALHPTPPYYTEVSPTHWKKSLHIALSPPFLFRHRMLLSAASWHGSKYSLYALLSFCQPSILPLRKGGIIEWVGTVRDAAVGDVLFEFRGRGTCPLGLVVFAELVFGHCVCRRDSGVKGRSRGIVWDKCCRWSLCG